MRIEQIKREMKRLQRTINSQPRVWRFRGRGVVRASEWKWADWSKFPDAYFGPMIHAKVTPADWYRDYLAVMKELQDPQYGSALCWYCTIYQAQHVKKEIDREICAL